MTRSSPASKGLEGILINIRSGAFDDKLYEFPKSAIIDDVDVGGILVRMKGGDTTSCCAANWTYEDDFIQASLEIIRKKCPKDVYLADPTILILDDSDETAFLASISLPDILEENPLAKKFGFIAQYGNGHWIYTQLTKESDERRGFRLDVYDSLNQSAAEQQLIYGMVHQYLSGGGVKISNGLEPMKDKFHIPKLQNYSPDNPTLHCGAYALQNCEELACDGRVEVITGLTDHDNEKVAAFLRARDVVRCVMAGRDKLAGVVNYEEVKLSVFQKIAEHDVADEGMADDAARASTAPAGLSGFGGGFAAAAEAAPPVPLADKCDFIFRHLERETGVNEFNGINVARGNDHIYLFGDDDKMIDIDKDGNFEGDREIAEGAYKFLQEELKKKASTAPKQAYAESIAAHTTVGSRTARK